MLELNLRTGQYVGVHIRRGDKGEWRVGNPGARRRHYFQCRGERRKLKRFRPIDTLIKLSIFCQETELSLPFTLPATRRRWLKNFAGVTHGISCVDDCLTALAGCSPNDLLQSTPVPLSPAFMIGGFVHFKFEYLPIFFRTHVPSRISYRPP